jgi:hypothetical protein
VYANAGDVPPMAHTIKLYSLSVGAGVMLSVTLPDGL